MENTSERLELKEEVNDSNGNVLDSCIISNILTYIYAEPRSINRIAQHVGISPVKLQIYMSYLEGLKLVELYEEENAEMIEKRYRICNNQQNIDLNIKVNSDIALLQYADQLCANLKSSILSLKADDVNELSCYIGEVPENALIRTIHNIQRLQNEVEESEKTITENDKAEKYMLITVFVPYKENAE